MRSDQCDPINVGQDRMVTINQLEDIIKNIAGIQITKKHVSGPQGVRGRNADLTLIRKILRWNPKISLEERVARTYKWIEEQVRVKLEKEAGDK